MTEVVEVARDDPRLLVLVRAQVSELAVRYAEAADHGFAQPALHPDTRWLLLLGADGPPVGCVALQPLAHTVPGAAADIGEVKRLYVVPEARGRGYSGELMVALEVLAIPAGYRCLQLETGRRQPEAVALYQHSGYHQITPYGHYRASPQSLCFRKTLHSTPELP